MNPTYNPHQSEDERRETSHFELRGFGKTSGKYRAGKTFSLGEDLMEGQDVATTTMRIMGGLTETKKKEDTTKHGLKSTWRKGANEGS